MEKKVCILDWESFYDILGYAQYAVKKLRFLPESSYVDGLFKDIEALKEVCLSDGVRVVVSMSDDISE